jgi:hypothetical protein
MAYLEKTFLVDEKDAVVNPASEESIVLLRRMVRLLEQQAACDPAQRQRITLDAITGGTTLPTVTAVGTVTTVSTVSSITAGTITTVGNAVQLAGYDQRLYADWARQAYNTGIRAGLSF